MTHPWWEGTQAFKVLTVLDEQGGNQPIGQHLVTLHSGLSSTQTRKALSEVRRNGHALELEPEVWVRWAGHKGWRTQDLFEWHQLLLDEHLEADCDTLEKFKASRLHGALRVLTCGNWGSNSGYSAKNALWATSLSRPRKFTFIEKRCDVYVRSDVHAFRRFAMGVLRFNLALPEAERKLLAVRRYVGAVNRTACQVYTLLAEDDLPPAHTLFDGSAFYFLREWDKKEMKTKRTHQAVRHQMADNAKRKRMRVTVTNLTARKLYFAESSMTLGVGETAELSRFDRQIERFAQRGQIGVKPA
jgi:hypothetical protein